MLRDLEYSYEFNTNVKNIRAFLEWDEIYYI